MDQLLERCQQHFFTEDLYKVLKMQPQSTTREVYEAYVKLFFKYKFSKMSEVEKHYRREKFKVIREAFYFIIDQKKRKMYDASVISRQLKKKHSTWQEREQPTSSQPKEQPTDESANRSGMRLVSLGNLRSIALEQTIDFDENTRYLEDLMRHMRIIGNVLYKFEVIRAEIYRRPRRSIPKYSED
ncbi:DnaJ domain [Cinara cedri]|uniref:DnaJ domain n=1 Tax=Cinara cedri TaxID=506608 RepID=A0A5E4NRM4_9HEMI|nr:DnaJ domain [Cinara cedri]